MIVSGIIHGAVWAFEMSSTISVLFALRGSESDVLYMYEHIHFVAKVRGKSLSRLEHIS